MAKKKKTNSVEQQLVLTRADNGDWTLHPPTKAKGVVQVRLLSGTAQRVDEQWNRPDERDYDLAQQMFSHHLEMARGK
jgi:hypothetical protein